MLRNYIKVAVRNLSRNKSYVFINVFGLSVAIAISIVIYLNWRHSSDANKNHTNYREIFKVHGKWTINGEPEKIGITPLPLTELLNTDLSTIHRAVRYTSGREIIKRGNEVFSEHIGYVDIGFLDVFDFPLLYGNKEAINQPGQIIISQEMAEKYFGSENALGKDIRLIVSGKEFLYTVGGVFKRPPTNGSFDFSIAMLSIENYFTHHPDVRRDNWGEWVDGTFVHIKNPDDKELVEKQMDAYLSAQNQANDHIPYESYVLDRIDYWDNIEDKLRYGQFRDNMDDTAVWGLNSSAILILLLSCFNFTNTSISFSNKRLKEIGIRKVFGGVRSQLITQFLIENLILIVIALVLGLVMAEMLIPAYNDLFWFVRLELDLLNNLNLLLFLLTLMVLVAAFSAIYPAVYISSFKPTNIFHGSVKFGSGNTFLKVLIAAQFIITVYNIFGGIVFYQNGKYQTTLDQGYDVHNTLVVPLKGDSDFNKLKNELSRLPDVVALAGSNTQIAFRTPFVIVEDHQQEYELGWMRIGHDYLETMGLEVMEGRGFQDGLDNENSNRALVNQQLIKDLGWENSDGIIGRRLRLDSINYTVIGVVKNFHERVMFRGGDIRPVVITMSPEDQFRYLVAKSDGSNMKGFNQEIKEAWLGLFPSVPYEGYFQTRAIEVVQDTNFIIDRINLVTVLVSILLSSIGLYTLVSLNIINKIKEIGIRKVLGASISNIVVLLNRNFAGLLMIGAIVGSISGYLVLDWLLDLIYSYRLPIDAWPMILSIVVLGGVALATVGTKVYAAARINPIDHLRNE